MGSPVNISIYEYIEARERIITGFFLACSIHSLNFANTVKAPFIICTTQNDFDDLWAKTSSSVCCNLEIKAKLLADIYVVVPVSALKGKHCFFLVPLLRACLLHF